MPQKFVFVPSKGSGKPRGSERKTIRSHCMKDRNRKQPKAPHRAPPTLLPYKNLPGDGPSAESEKDWAITLLNKGIDTHASTGRNTTISHPPPLDLYFMSFPSEVSARSKTLLFKYYEVSSSTLYIDSLNQPLHRSKAAWHEWFATDVAFMHAVLCVVSGVDDFVRKQPISRYTYLHLRMAVRLLNQQLTSAEAVFIDSTIAVVVMLGYLALGMGEIGEARAHVDGLQQIVQLRGGLGSFGINPKLIAKVCHFDICFYLMTGETPRFLFPRLPSFPSQGLSRLLTGGGSDLFQPSIDIAVSPRLTCLFKKLQILTEFINAAPIYSSSVIKDTGVHDIFYSIHYQLVYLHGMLEETSDELMRLAMLAFMATTYRIPGGRMPYHYLTKRYRALCKENLPSDPDLRLWLLLIGAISVFDVTEVWLGALWRVEVPQMSWEDVRQRIRGILWIDAIHDEPGRKAFDKLNKRRLRG